MKSTRILCALAFAAVISQGVLLSTTQVQASSVNTVSTHRLAGESRYETSIAISQGGWDKADTVIITSGEKFADALCAGPLAQKYDAPILLTPSSYISENTINELARLQAKNIILVGGTASISTNVEDKLKAVGYTNIDRIGGKDRYETSIMIAEKLDKTDKVVIASGENFPDALSISAVASKLGMPILLSPTSNLSEYAKEFIENNNIKETYIIGGEGVLSALIEKEVPSPVRLGGDNRYGTNLAVIKYFEKDLNFDNVYLTLGEGPTGDEFADALSGAALAGNKSAPILMTNGSIDNGINTFIKSKLNLNTKAVALGGQAVVPDALIKTVMDEKTVVPVVKTYDKAGTYSGGEISGSVTISASDVYLKNTIIKGDLLIASTVNDGNIDLDNVIVTGKTIINGGGANSVHYHNGNAGNIHLDKPIGEETRVIIDENASIDSILVESNGILDETKATKPGNVTIQQNSTLKLIGKFDNVEVKGQGANVTAENAAIGALRVTDSAKNSSISIGKNSSVQTISAKSDVAISGEGQIGKVSIESASINVKVQATNVNSLEVTKDAKGSMINIDENAKVNTLTLNAAADIKGKGEIKNASVNAEGTTLEQKPSSLNIGKGISSIVGGNKETGTAASGGSSGGGNSGGGSSHSELAIISVAVISDINVPNGTEASAIGLPSAVQVTLSNNSTVNANVNWDTSSYNGSTAGTYTLTGTIVNPTNVTNTGNKTASIKVTVQQAVPVTKNISSVGTIADKTVVNGTTVDLLNLPSAVEVTLEDGSTVNANVNWDTSSYNGSTAGTYTLTGTIVNPTNVTNTGSKTASVKITVENPVVTGGWQDVGTAGFSLGDVNNTSLYVYNGIPYVVYQDIANSYKATVKKFNGNDWEDVGEAGFSDGATDYTSIYVDNGIPYVLYVDYAHNRKATLKRFNGNVWEDVGTAGFSAGIIASPALYVYNGIPYVAYQDSTVQYRATVRRFNGDNWEDVGSPGFSINTSPGISLYVDNGIPYISYRDWSVNYKATVKKFNGDSWENVGSAGFSTGTVDATSIYVDNGIPYVAYADRENGNKATVKKFSNDGWQDVGTAGFSAGIAYYTKVYVDNGTPYVAYTDKENGNRATVKKFNGDDWEDVGRAGFSAGVAGCPSLFIYDGIPYVAYGDGGNGNRATVKKFVGETAPVTKNISSLGTIEDKTVANGTTVDSLNLPVTVEVTLDDGSTVQADVTWDTSSYNGSVAGTYTLTGTITNPANVTNTGNLTASVKVIVKAPTSKIVNVLPMEDINVAFNTPLSSVNLPSKAHALIIPPGPLPFQVPMDIDVSWNLDNTNYNPSVPGTYTIIGTFRLSDGMENSGNVVPSIKVVVGSPVLSSEKEIIGTTIGTLINGTITELARGTKVSELKAGVTVSQKARVEILETAGGNAVTDEAATDVTSTMVIKVTAEDGSSAEYAIGMAIEHTEAPLADNITVANNNLGTPDTIVVSGVNAGDKVRVYDSLTGGTLLGEAIAMGVGSFSIATITVPQLGVEAGKVYVSTTSPEKLESVRTEKSYAAEVISNIVYNLNDDNSEGSLRKVVEKAKDGDTITFDQNLNGTIILLSHIDIDKDIKIVGDTRGVLTISGNDNNRIFNIGAGKNVELSYLNFTKGTDNNSIYLDDENDPDNRGGAIHNLGNLIVNNSNFYQNSAFFSGGAITSWQGATLVVNNSTFSGNKAGSEAMSAIGGAIYGHLDADITINNSTFSGNSTGTEGFGGAIWIESGNLIVNSSTISGNTAGTGGGICTGIEASVTLKNTIVSDNGLEDIRASVNATNSLISTLEGCNLVSGSNNIIGQSANLGQLQNNGGTTQTMMPNVGSPVIDAGDDNEVSGTDQRGLPRRQGNHVDIGAVESSETAEPASEGNGS